MYHERFIFGAWPSRGRGREAGTATHTKPSQPSKIEMFRPYIDPSQRRPPSHAKTPPQKHNSEGISLLNMNPLPAETMLPPPARLSSHHGVLLDEYPFNQQSSDKLQANSRLLKKSKFAAYTRVIRLPPTVANANSAQDTNSFKALMSNDRPSVLEPVPKGWVVRPRLFLEAPSTAHGC
jgi:hypothetical protein